MTQSLVELEGPEDSISSLEFCPSNPTYLLASSWDRHLRLYDIATRQIVRDFAERAPILACCFTSQSTAVSGSLDGSLRSYDLESGELSKCTSPHSKAISSLTFSSAHNILVSGSWDGTLSVQSGTLEGHAYSIKLPEKIFALSNNENHLVVAMANRQVYIYALADLKASLTQHSEVLPIQRRESSLKFMTRTVKCTTTQDATMAGYVSTSIEGRVAVEFMDPSEASQTRKYAFKCHRQKEGTGDSVAVYPVNAVDFHPVYGTFATAGGDGVVSVWDLKNKKRVKQYSSIGFPIKCIAFSSDARVLAMGTMTEDDQGPCESRQGRIFLRTLAPGEGKGK